MSEKFLDYVEYRLQQWAEWFSRGNCYGIGYPSSSIEHRLMREGTLTRNKYAKQVLICHEDAEEIEKLVKEMASYNNRMSTVLRCHYFSNGGLRDKAKQLEISHTQFKYYVDMAKQWLSGRLVTNENIKFKNTCNVNTSRV